MSDKRNNQYSVHCTIGSCTEYKEYNVFLAFFLITPMLLRQICANVI